MNILSSVDGDEVSLVKRAANRRRFLLLKGDDDLDVEISDLLEVPWEREGSLLDGIRKDGADENVEKAVIAAVRLLKGVEGALSPEMVEKLGVELYGKKNPKLNTSSVPEVDDLEGRADGADLDSSEDGASKDGSASGGSLEGSGSAPKVAADADEKEPDEDDKKKPFGKKVNKEDSAGLSDLDKPDNDDTEGGTVEVQVPVRKEDGTWDLSGVPEESRPFFQEMIQKADKTESELKETREQLEKADDSLLTRSMVEKAARYNHVAATDDLAPVLKECSQKLDAETFEKLEGIFAAAEERVQKGDLFTEMGRTGAGAPAKSDAYSQLLEKADALVEKDTDMSKEQAFDRALRDNPALYDQYMADMGMGVR